MLFEWHAVVSKVAVSIFSHRRDFPTLFDFKVPRIGLVNVGRLGQRLNVSTQGRRVAQTGDERRHFSLTAPGSDPQPGIRTQATLVRGRHATNRSPEHLNLGFICVYLILENITTKIAAAKEQVKQLDIVLHLTASGGVLCRTTSLHGYKENPTTPGQSSKHRAVRAASFKTMVNISIYRPVISSKTMASGMGKIDSRSYKMHHRKKIHVWIFNKCWFFCYYKTLYSPWSMR